MAVDAYGSWSHYLSHICAVLRAVPDERRGCVYLGLNFNEHAAHVASLGCEPARGRPPAIANEPVLIASAADLPHAEGRPIVFVEHGAGQVYDGNRDNPGYTGGRGRDQVRLFLSPNDRVGGMNVARYPEAEYAAIGDPTIRAVAEESTEEESTDRPQIAVTFHFDLPLCPETRWTFPQWKQALFALAQEYTVIGHAHPKAQHQILPWYSDNHIMCSDDWQQASQHASLCIVDNSSVGLEFARSGRPVLWLNGQQYRKDVWHGLRFWDVIDWSPMCDHPEELFEAVKDALDDPPDRQLARAAATKKIYPYVGDDAAQRAAGAILERWP